MSHAPSPWPDRPGPPAAPDGGAGWAQPGPASAAPPAGFGQPGGPAGHPGSMGTAYAPVPSPYAPPAGYPAAAPGYAQPYPPPGFAPPLRTDYAGWGKRVGASMIDHLPTYVGLVVFYAGYFVWLFQLSLTSGSGTPDLTAGLVPIVIGMVLMLAGFGWSIYNRWILAGRTGQSLGKRVTKIRLVSEVTDAPVGATNAFLRDLVHILDGMAYVGYLWPLWDDKRQTFADKLMRTVVVNAS